MNENPMFNAKEHRKTHLNRFLVVFVVRNIQNLKETTDVRELCISEGIAFKIRDYCSRTYHEDCEYVERLPAFHIYLDKKYEQTLYPHTLYKDSILSFIDSVAEKERQLDEKRRAWRNPLRLFNRLFNLSLTPRCF